MTPLAKCLAATLIALMIGIPWCLYIGERRRPATPPYEPAAIRRASEAAKGASEKAETLDAKAAESRPAVKAAREAAHAAIAIRVKSGILVADLPQPMADEHEALMALLQASTEQLEIEQRRAEAWREAAIASQAAAEAARLQLEATAKVEWRRGFKWGAGIGAAAAILAAILL